MRTTIMRALLFTSVAIACSAGAQTDQGVVESYSGSLNLPDEIAFGQFLAMAEGASRRDQISADRFMARAFGVDLESSDGYVRTSGYLALFHETSLAVARDWAAEKHAVLCSGDLPTKSFDEIADAMNAVDDVHQQVLARHLAEVMVGLSSEESSAFLSFLDVLKKGTSFARIDNRHVYETGELDIRADLERRCVELTNDLGGDFQ